MDGKLVIDYAFKKNATIKNMGKKVTIKVGNETIQIDPLLFFQRIVTAGMNSGELKTTFTFELCTYPPAMFENVHLMLIAQKAPLKTAQK